LRDAVVRRARLVRFRAPVEAHLPPARLVWSEIAYVARLATGQVRKPLATQRAADPRVVLLIPGFATNGLRMRHMARELERAGHKVKRWKLGYNLGPSEEKFDRLSQRLLEIHRRYGKPVYLVGWSLGGVFAREIAKRHPEVVAKVVTMGSPFSHTPYSNRVWRTYQLVTGHSVEDPPVRANLREKPPVETVALWSPRDAMISPRAARGLPGERDRAVALRCTHLGFSDSPESIRAVLAELA
jgi:pimeloyl-ACP methyl ester carboxylesterase